MTKHELIALLEALPDDGSDVYTTMMYPHESSPRLLPIRGVVVAPVCNVGDHHGYLFDAPGIYPVEREAAPVLTVWDYQAEYINRCHAAYTASRHIDTHRKPLR